MVEYPHFSVITKLRLGVTLVPLLGFRTSLRPEGTKRHFAIPAINLY